MMHLIDPPKKELNVGHSVGGIQYVASKVMHSELLSQKSSISFFVFYGGQENSMHCKLFFLLNMQTERAFTFAIIECCIKK